MEKNKELVREFHSRLNRGDVEGAAGLAAVDLVNHAAIPQAQGRAGWAVVLAKLREAFPDLFFQVDDLVAEGDHVVARCTVTGTHRGALAFETRLEPTGRSFNCQQIHIFRLASGQIVEHWGGRDDIGMLRQLGFRVNVG